MRSGDQRASDATGCQRVDACAHSLRQILAPDPVGDDEADEDIQEDQRHLTTSERQEPTEDPRNRADAPRRPFERARQHPERQREISEADDFAGVLQSGIGRAAKREGERGDESASGMPWPS